MAVTETSNLKEELRRLIEELPETELRSIVRFAEFVAAHAVHPAVLAIKNAPVRNDEPLTDEDRERIQQAREDFQAGRFVTLDEAWKRLVESEPE